MASLGEVRAELRESQERYSSVAVQREMLEAALSSVQRESSIAQALSAERIQYITDKHSADLESARDKYTTVAAQRDMLQAALVAMQRESRITQALSEEHIEYLSGQRCDLVTALSSVKTELCEAREKSAEEICKLKTELSAVRAELTVG
jgi:hypothetical protein